MHVKDTKPMPKRATTKMKRLLRIFDLSKNEQRVVLIVMVVLIAIAFVRYERRVHRPQVEPKLKTEQQPSLTAPGTEDDR
jgi:hypothetical protein